LRVYMRAVWGRECGFFCFLFFFFLTKNVMGSWG
jgi:hypothetical protein